MSSDPSTPLLTVEGLIAMVAERNALWAKANQLTSQIEHIRQFIGDDRFFALVGPQDAAPAVAPAAPRRQRDELTMSDVILRALENQPDGLSYDELRERIEESGLPKRSPNTFFNTISRLHSMKDAVRAGSRMFSLSAYADLAPERLTELQLIDSGGRGTTGVAKATVDTLRASERGMTAAEVIKAMATTHPDIKANAIYASLSRLKIADALVRDDKGRYALPQHEDRAL